MLATIPVVAAGRGKWPTDDIDHADANALAIVFWNERYRAAVISA